MAKGISKAEARRRAAAIRATIHAEEPLISGLNLDRLVAFKSDVADPEHADAVNQAVMAVCGRARHIQGHDSFRRGMSDVSVYAAWAAAQGRSLAWRSLMDHEVIHDFARAPHPLVSNRTHSERIVRLRTMASTINPGPTAPPRLVAGKQVRNKPPYVAREDAALIRWAKGQSSAKRSAQLQLILGLARGAGASSADLRKVRQAHILDRGEEGIDVTLGDGATERTVPVRRAYETLVRNGLAGAPRCGLLFGSAKNAINHIVEQSECLSTDVPRLEVSRLRTTWLAELMTLPIPLSTLMAAAGLQSARAFADVWEAQRDAGIATDAELGVTR